MIKLTILKLKNQILEHKIIYSILFLSVIFLFFSVIFGVKVERDVNLLDGSSSPSESLENGVKYVQNFKANVNELNAVGIKFSTYRNENKNGSLKINLYDQNDNLIKESKINVEDIKDNQIMYIKFDKIKDSMNKNYKIELYLEDYNENNTLVYWLAESDENNILTCDGVKMDSSINLILTGKIKDKTVFIYPLLVILVCLILLVII